MLGGFAVAKGLIAVFNAGGGGFPPAPMVFKPRTAIVAAIVGIGVTVASVLLPRLARLAHPTGRGDATRGRLLRDQPHAAAC